jgi:hypothetical protein
VGKRYAVVGNCQSAGFAAGIKAIQPDAEVDVYSYRMLMNDEAIVQRLETLDTVFAQPALRASYGAVRTEQLSKRLRNMVLFPAITFRGFHPDEISLQADGKDLSSPIGGAHSLIAAAAYAEGLSAARATRLFNAYVYSALGYFEEYERSLAFLKEAAARTGLTLPIDAWRAQGSFMYSGIHPKAFVIASIVPLAMARAGEAVPAGEPPAIRDGLAKMGVLPVFPEIAGRLGFKGDTIYLKNARLRGPDGDRRIGLEDYVAGCFAIYRANPGVNLDLPQIAAARERLRAAGLR